jgi:hypothetical protein
MIHLPASVRVYLCLSACDMRKSFDGLHALVREHLELDAFGGHPITERSTPACNSSMAVVWRSTRGVSRFLRSVAQDLAADFAYFETKY